MAPTHLYVGGIGSRLTWPFIAWEYYGFLISLTSFISTGWNLEFFSFDDRKRTRRRVGRAEHIKKIILTFLGCWKGWFGTHKEIILTFLGCRKGWFGTNKEIILTFFEGYLIIIFELIFIILKFWKLIEFFNIKIICLIIFYFPFLNKKLKIHLFIFLF